MNKEWLKGRFKICKEWKIMVIKQEFPMDFRMEEYDEISIGRNIRRTNYEYY